MCLEEESWIGICRQRGCRRGGQECFSPISAKWGATQNNDLKRYWGCWGEGETFISLLMLLVECALREFLGDPPLSSGVQGAWNCCPEKWKRSLFGEKAAEGVTFTLVSRQMLVSFLMSYKDAFGGDQARFFLERPLKGSYFLNREFIEQPRAL